ncbi:BLUF domain-containing protein [Hymenobacter sp. RP-2-7]|uniref:BLUF domain-containing protein n=1 Tax=Hymenobacter polaris TaxID=2682546 RepID=A0A7Y0AAK5_9BACT|nr:BLUF domain-containing protein [Hymenobacter polaris]NML63788.1 BLUF domain-containing protein [Hymenobacter polaris]
MSEATANLSEAALLTLLQQAWAEHQRAQLTGLLLYRDGRFLQILEGPETPLREFFSRVAADPRHGKLELLADGPKPVSDFQDWHMSFACTVPGQCTQLPGYLQLEHLLALTKSTSVRHLLHEFLVADYVPLH